MSYTKAPLSPTKWKQKIEQLLEDRSKTVVELGEKAHYHFALDGRTSFPEWEELSRKIRSLDEEIFAMKEQKFNAQGAEKNCEECGKTMEAEDKFCGSCGHENPVKSLEEETITCQSCQSHNPEDAAYCICCGQAVKEESHVL